MSSSPPTIISHNCRSQALSNRCRNITHNGRRHHLSSHPHPPTTISLAHFQICALRTKTTRIQINLQVCDCPSYPSSSTIYRYLTSPFHQMNHLEVGATSFSLLDLLYGRATFREFIWRFLCIFYSCEPLGKLSPRYIGPYEVIERIGPVAYRLALPEQLFRIHDVFHVSILRKYIADPSHVLEFQPVQMKENLTYEEEPVRILDKKVQVECGMTISLVKVLWKNHTVEETMWENEDQMRAQYPDLLRA